MSKQRANLDQVLDEISWLLRQSLNDAGVSGEDRQKILTSFQRSVKDNYRNMLTDLFGG